MDTDTLCGKEAKGNSIDKQVEDTQDTLQELYTRFLVDGKCCCPMCKAMNKSERNRRYYETV